MIKLPRFAEGSASDEAHAARDRSGAAVEPAVARGGVVVENVWSGAEGSAGDEAHAARDRSGAAVEPAIEEVTF